MSDTTNYRKSELGNITGSGGQIKVKFVNDEGETKWLNITSDEFAAMESVLTADPIAERLEYLRSQIEAQTVSYGELVELQGLAEHIESGDVQLLEAVGVPEFPED